MCYVNLVICVMVASSHSQREVEQLTQAPFLMSATKYRDIQRGGVDQRDIWDAIAIMFESVSGESAEFTHRTYTNTEVVLPGDA